jgi:hypothetical protein
MDKQGLKKHHFWILLALTVVLIPVVLGGAMFGVGSAARQEKAKIDEKLKALAGVSPKSDGYIAKLEEQKGELQKHRDRVWELAYKAQDGLIRWPEKLSHNDTLHFGDPISNKDLGDYMHSDVYLAEYNKLYEILAPTTFNGGRWNYVLRPPTWRVLPTTEEAWLAVEDFCVQRELLRDIQAINQMLAGFIKLPALPTEPPADAPQQDKDAYKQAVEQLPKQQKAVEDALKAEFQAKPGDAVGRFLSPYWQLDLHVTRAQSARVEYTFRGKLKNVSPRRQNVSRIEFKVYLRNPSAGPNVEAVTVPVEAEYLAAGQTQEFTQTRIGPAEPRLTIYKVEQKLDLRFAPVKRVDRLELSYQSHRFANKALQPSAFSEKAIADAAAAAPALDPSGIPSPDGGAGSPDGGFPGGDSGRGSPEGGPGFGPGGMRRTDYTVNGLKRLRYLDRTDQVRRMPIATVLIVDQAHVQDVLRALANSRLRFQTTQWTWTRFRGAIALNNYTDLTGSGEFPTGVPGDMRGEGGPSGRLGGPTGSPDGGFPGEGGPRGGFPPPGGRGIPSPGIPSPGIPSPGIPSPGIPSPGVPAPGVPAIDPNTGQPIFSEEGSASLVELSVYGLVSLYERFPPKAPQPEAGAPTDPGAAPAAPLPVEAPPAAPATPPPPTGAPVPPPPGPPPK